MAEAATVVIETEQASYPMNSTLAIVSLTHQASPIWAPDPEWTLATVSELAFGPIGLIAVVQYHNEKGRADYMPSAPRIDVEDGY